MKVIFMGTPDFAVGTLEALVKSEHEVVAVVTQPDKPKGRGKAMQPTPVKEVAVRENIPVLQPRKVRDPEVVEELRENADLRSEDPVKSPPEGLIKISLFRHSLLFFFPVSPPVNTG